MSQIETVPPERAVRMMQDGAVLIDIRESNEHASENIPGARHHALSQIDAAHPAREGGTVLIFHCKSGARTRMNAGRLAAASGDCDIYLLEGGIEAWKRAGLPTANGTGETDHARGGLIDRVSSLFR
jgi:rhodanese-related sulfurtransferase